MKFYKKGKKKLVQTLTSCIVVDYDSIWPDHVVDVLPSCTPPAIRIILVNSLGIYSALQDDYQFFNTFAQLGICLSILEMLAEVD